MDVIYVIFYRYSLGEPIYTRHFYQIYQIAKEKQKNHMYLLIQPVNALIALSIYILIKLGVNETYSVIGSSILITLIYYFLLRHYLLRDNIKMIKVCIVGLGSHAKNKIIPAIKLINSSQLAVVTSQKDFSDNNVRIFENVNEAISNLEKDYIFYISTPPSSHFEIAKKFND